MKKPRIRWRQGEWTCAVWVDLLNLWIITGQGPTPRAAFTDATSSQFEAI